MEDRRGALWIGTMQSLYRRSADGRVEPIAPSSRPDLLTIHALLEDRDGRVWVGTRYAGVFQLTVDAASQRPTVTHVYAAPRDLPTNWINTIVQSADGAVWVGSNRGVFHFLPDPGGDAYRIRVYSTSEGADEVWAIAEDRQHNLWLGRRHVWRGKAVASRSDEVRRGGWLVLGELDQRDPERRRDRGGRARRESLVPVPVRRNEVRRRAGFRCQACRRVGDGARWCCKTAPATGGSGPASGLFRFTNLETIDDVERSSPSAIYTTRDGLAGPQVLRLFEDSSGDVWIGTVGGARHGLSRWQRRTGTFHHYTDGGWSPAARPVLRCFFRRGSGGTRVDRLRRDRWTGASSGRALRAFHRG